jgi:hypothetical protein
VTSCRQVVEVRRRFGRMYCLHLLAPSFLPVTRLAYSPTIKLDAVCSSETSVNFCRIAWCHIPEGNTLINVYLQMVQKFNDLCCLVDTLALISKQVFYYNWYITFVEGSVSRGQTLCCQLHTTCVSHSEHWVWD